ncbi:hypothetical protein [Georgenia subflava]|uniref:ABC transporter permease n=1 Tax=Georgenia subflava TaxID=1622177 RepID=A0A6N7ELS8_9MICO|nr:hypothetical protein [Georgenia subflava]MPV36204.1 hypothetical protein [Georgenia subflava]
MSTLETMPSTETDDGPTPSRDIVRMLGLAVALALTACLALLAVVVPGQNSMPREVPIGLAGPEETVSQLANLLSTAQPDAYDVRIFDDAEAMRDATEQREIYGGFVMDESSPGVIIATGASPALASFLTSFGGQLGLTNVSDVAQTTAADPTATGILVAVVLTSILSLLGAFGLARLEPGRPRAQVVGAVVLAVVTGLAVAGSLQLLGSVEGVFWTVAGAVALAVLGGTLAALGLIALLGLVGAVAYLVIVVLPGIGLAGMTSAPEMLPAGWGTLGQYLPPGASGSLLQSVAYFGGGGALRPVLVLLGWAVLGLVLVALGTLRRRRADARAAALEAALAAEAEADAEEAAESRRQHDDSLAAGPAGAAEPASVAESARTSGPAVRPEPAEVSEPAEVPETSKEPVRSETPGTSADGPADTDDRGPAEPDRPWRQ